LRAQEYLDSFEELASAKAEAEWRCS
jgi:hypothetical protein